MRCDARCYWLKIKINNLFPISGTHKSRRKKKNSRQSTKFHFNCEICSDSISFRIISCCCCSCIYFGFCCPTIERIQKKIETTVSSTPNSNWLSSPRQSTTVSLYSPVITDDEQLSNTEKMADGEKEEAVNLVSKFVIFCDFHRCKTLSIPHQSTDDQSKYRSIMLVLW